MVEYKYNDPTKYSYISQSFHVSEAIADMVDMPHLFVHR